MPRLILPDPKLLRSATAKPARMAISTMAMMPVPTLDLETRRKKESIGVPVRMEEDSRFRGRAGAHQAAQLRGANTRGDKGNHAAQEARRRELEDAWTVVRSRRDSRDRGRGPRLFRGRRRTLCALDPDRAGGACGARISDRRTGRPSSGEGRTHGLHVSADAS